MYIERHLGQILKKAKKSMLLLGPRQTGKSTLIKSLKPEIEINLADEATFVDFLKDPALLKKRIGKSKSLFIDEVQRIPSLLNTVQSMIDQDKSLRFYLTGSSARKLKRGKANLLPGRVLFFKLGPLTPTELGNLFEVEKALSRGLLPEIYLEEDEALVKKLLRSYSIGYLKEEIQAEALTRNLEGFSRFFELAASRSGDFVDFTKWSSEARIERTSAARYFDILVDTMILTPLNAFSKSIRRRLIQHPRYYFFDVGVLNGILNNFEISADRKGLLFETLVCQTILSEAQSRDEEIRLSTYRTDAGAEVDFILEKDREVFAIEVKASRNIGKTDLSGLRSFSNFYGKSHQPMIVYMGEHEMELEGVLVLPLQKALTLIFT